MEFGEFQVNPAVPPDTFAMIALKLRDGERVIDRRPGVKTRVYRYNTLKHGTTKAAIVGSMLDELKALDRGPD